MSETKTTPIQTNYHRWEYYDGMKHKKCSKCGECRPADWPSEGCMNKSAAYNEAATSGDVQVVEPHQPTKREKFCHIGAPKCFALEQAMQHVNAAFNSYGSYTVGSVLDRPDWRDVDVRMIMSDEDFEKEFPDAEQHWEQDEKWLLLTVAISEWLSKQTGLPIDFQFQSQTHANKRHKGKRNAVGLRFGKKDKSDGA